MALPTILPLLARDTLLGQRKLWNPCKAASSLRLRKRLSLAQAVSGLRAAQLATLDYLHSLNLVWTRIVVEPEVVAGGSCTCDCGNIARGDLPEVFPGSCVDDVPVQIPNTLRLELLPSCQNVVPLGFAKLLDVHLGTLGSPFSKKSSRQANLLSGSEWTIFGFLVFTPLRVDLLAPMMWILFRFCGSPKLRLFTIRQLTA